MPEKRVTIRGMDERTYKRARTAALKAGIPVGDWICQIIREHLARKKGKEA